MKDFSSFKTLTLFHFVLTLCADNVNDIVVPCFLNEYNSRQTYCYILRWLLSELLNSSLLSVLPSTSIVSLMLFFDSFLTHLVIMNYYLFNNKTLFIIIACQRKILICSSSHLRVTAQANIKNKLK